MRLLFKDKLTAGRAFSIYNAKLSIALRSNRIFFSKLLSLTGSTQVKFRKDTLMLAGKMRCG